METKTFEIRDKATFIPALGVRVSGADGYLMRRAGFDGFQVYLIHLEGQTCAYDPYEWTGRRTGSMTMKEAHAYIEQNWDNLTDGQVIDVEFILGVTKKPKLSERIVEAMPDAKCLAGPSKVKCSYCNNAADFLIAGVLLCNGCKVTVRP